MNDDESLAFYERLYFHELECRDAIIARLQLLLGLLTAVLAVIAAITCHLTFAGNASEFAEAMFVVFFTTGVVLTVASSIHFTKAFWGHTYEALPTAVDIEAYRTTLLKTYEKYPGGLKIAQDYHRHFLLRYFSECAAANALVNQARYQLMQDAGSFIIPAIPAVIAAALAVIFGGLAKASVFS